MSSAFFFAAIRNNLEQIVSLVDSGKRNAGL